MENRPTLSQSVRIWSKVGLLSFGGPAAQIALMHREIVDRQNWLSEAQFLNALNFCMLLPGPEAMQLATYAGWRQWSVGWVNCWTIVCHTWGTCNCFISYHLHMLWRTAISKCSISWR